MVEVTFRSPTDVYAFIARTRTPSTLARVYSFFMMSYAAFVWSAFDAEPYDPTSAWLRRSASIAMVLACVAAVGGFVRALREEAIIADELWDRI